MEKSFRKRPGTIDKGKEYEVVSVANIAMNLAADENIKDFHISFNDDDFGAFDDVVIEAELENGTEQYALQLKHSDRGILSLNHFTQPKGDYSFKKYFDSWKTIKVSNVKCILFTNLKFNFKEGSKFQLKDQNFFIAPRKIVSNDACKISQTDYCYKFSIVQDASYNNSDEVLLYEKFFDSFFLYPDQENLHDLKLRVTKKFKATFCGNDVESKEYVNFINEWSLRDREVEKLNKKWIKLIIALKIFSSRIQPLSFHFNNYINDTNITKRNILREAIDSFDISIFQNESYDQLRELWNDAKCELEDLKALNKLRTKYHVDSNYFSNVAKIDSLSLSIILWLMGKCPLILKQDASVDKALELCEGKKCILLQNDLLPENVAAFKTLSDLKPKTLQYNHLLQNLTCSLQGKREIRLIELINGNEEMLTVIKTDDLLEMTIGQCTIAEAEETLPVPYIERSLLKNVIDNKIIDNFTKETQIILDCVLQKNYLNNTLKRHNLVDINDYLNAEIQQKQLLNINSSFEKKSHTELSSLGTTIYLSEKRCEHSEFNYICNKTKNAKHFHQFRLRDDGNLEWIRSKGGISDLEKYKLSQYYAIHERDLSSSKFNNNINLLVSDPGMGKSELMKSFQIKCFPDCFTVIIDFKDVYSFLRNVKYAENYADVFLKFLLYKKFKTLSERDTHIFRIFLKTNKIIYVWDALDELPDKYRNIVIEIITELSQNCVQWVTSRCHLQNMLERKFNVLSLNLTKFNEQEQSNYIEERLGDVDSTKTIKEIIDKIKSSFALVEHRDILGIPLQLFMLTELFRQDRYKYLKLLNNFFPLTDLYGYFIQEKMDIHYREKLGLVPNTISAEVTVQTQKDKLLDRYTNAALKLLFPDEILKELSVRNKQSIQLIEESDKNVGLITDVTDQIPRFLHNSFAEYLAARYLANNLNHKQIQPQNFFDPKYNNVRFFFDLILAKDSEAHVAILYKNFSFIQSCESQVLENRDVGGRSVLHLACSWGQRYSELSVKYTGNTCIVDDEQMSTTVSESSEYLETIDYLLEECNISQIDQIYDIPAREYAHNTNCLAAEMRIMMKQNNQDSIESNKIINILHYSSYYGYYHEFVYFFEQLRNSAQQGNITTEYTLSRNVMIKNNNGFTFLLTAAAKGHVKIVEFLVTADADINLGNNYDSTPLHVASEQGHEKTVEFLVNASAGINLANFYGFTPLYVASRNGHEKIVEFLVKAGAGINRADKYYGFTPLHVASVMGHDKIVEFLVEADAGINFANKSNSTPLHVASEKGNEKIVEFLIKAGAGINLADDHDSTPLHVASEKGCDEIVKLLVKAGAGINLANFYGFTPLYIASRNGHENIVEFLVEAGVCINLADNHDSTPLHVASEKGHNKIVEFLVKADADLNLANNHNSTPIHVASEKGNDKIVKFLVEAGAGINLADNHDSTPLHVASEKGHAKIVDFLVNEGADMNLPNNYNSTPLHVASEKGDDKIVELLVEAGAGINLADNHDSTPLHVASEKGHDKIVEFLVTAGADMNRPNNYNSTPLHVASEKGNDKIVELLVNAGAGINDANNYNSTPLYVASEQGHDKIVEFLVKGGAGINDANNYNSTPLYVACEKGHDKIVEFLVKEGAGINLAKFYGFTPLYVASRNGYGKIVEFLVQAGARINFASIHGFTPLYVASRNGHKKIVEFLVKAGAGINDANNYNSTPLYVASEQGHDKIVEFLVKGGAGINDANNYNSTPLYVASEKGHDQIVNFLVKAGADLNLANNHNSTPLHVASERGNDKIVEFLVKAGAGINLANNCNSTPLHIASEKGDGKIVESLVKAGAGINLVNNCNSTPLHVASAKGTYKIVEFLVQAGAGMNLADSYGSTPLHVACEKGHTKIVEFLVEGGAGINLANFHGFTPLYVVSRNGHEKIVEFLVKAGASINLADIYDSTPLHVASEKGHDKIVKFLVKEGAGMHHTNFYGSTPLHVASRNGHEKIAEFLSNPFNHEF